MNFPIIDLQILSLSTIIGLSGVSLLLSAILLRLLLSFKISNQASYFFASLLFVISLMPVSGDSISLYVRGLINDLSITTLILLVYYFSTATTIKPEKKQHSVQLLYIIIVISGILFYPMALGYGPIDPYAWGFINTDHGRFIPLLFLVILAGLMWLAFIKNNLLLLICLSSATLAYQLNLLASHNLWDYLFDPIIFIYALLTLGSTSLKKLTTK